jgi:O-antigen ligase
LTEENQPDRRIAVVIERGLQYATYLFLLYVLTGIKKGGDMRLFIPYITAAFLIAYFAVRRDFSALRSLLFFSLAGYVAVSYCLVFYSVAPAVSLAGLGREVLPGLVLFLAMHVQSDSAEKVKGLLRVFAAALVLLAGGGYITYIGMDEENGNFRPLVPDIEFLKFKLYHNVFAMKVNFVLPFAGASSAFLGTKRARYLLWGGIAAASFAVILSLSRGGWLSLLAVFCLYALFLSRGRMKLPRALASVGLFLVISCAVVWLVFPTVRQRMLGTSPEQLRTVTYRTGIWQNFISGVGESPVVGWGYGDRIVWHEGPVVTGTSAEDTVPDQFKIGTHNTVLFVLFHQGIVGLVFYLLFIVAGAVRLLTFLMKKDDPVTPLLACSLLAAFAGVYLLHSTIETLPFAFPCIIFGILSGRQQKRNGERALSCPR